jgi:ribosomal protein S18 acetylase RimI-like enzyme
MTGLLLSPTQTCFHPPAPVPGVVFSLAQPDDLSSLQANSYTETDPRQVEEHFSFLLKWQATGRCYLVVGETVPETEMDGGTAGKIIIGSGQLIRLIDKAEIAELAVNLHYRNRGIGSAIIHILTGIAGQNGLDMVEIGVTVDNREALKLYRRLGFSQERRVELPGPQEAILLRKSF